MKVIIKISIIIMLIFSSFIKNYVAQNKEETIISNYESYRQEIKSIFENHYCRKFKLDYEMNNACIEYVERLIDGRPGKTYKACNYFISRRFKKSVYDQNENISKNDIYFADFRLEFVENILCNPEVQMAEPDKIDVVFGEYNGYCYVVVGVTSSWYERNPDLWVFENDNN